MRDPARLSALERSGLIGTESEDAFDRLVELAAELIGAPRVCITLVDAEYSTAMSLLGYPEGASRSAPVDQSFCRFVVGSGRPLVVGDALRDPRTAGDPVIEAHGVAAWAGYPIEDAEGVTLGTFCVMDSSPHEWTARDLHVLATLAKAASTEIALRRSQADTIVAHEGVAAVRSAEERTRAALLEHLHQLIADDEPSAPFATALLAWLRTADNH